MEIVEDSLDGLLVVLYETLMNSGDKQEGSRGPMLELLGVTLRAAQRLKR